jgi:hypothetical protein
MKPSFDDVGAGVREDAAADGGLVPAAGLGGGAPSSLSGSTMAATSKPATVLAAAVASR